MFRRICARARAARTPLLARASFAGAAAFSVAASTTTLCADSGGGGGRASSSATAVGAVGGELPVSTEEFARRAYESVRNPQYNPLKVVMDQSASLADMPPMLGIFNDVPWHKLREDEVKSWAKAGFSWIVNDGEHQIYEGRYGTEHNATMLRMGLLPVQRMHREAVSEHGDALCKGARATMRPYGTTLAEAEQYFKAVTYPTVGEATRDDRGGFPMREGNRRMTFTPGELRHAERDTQGWIQFETSEYIVGGANNRLRDAVLDLMAAQGPNKACGFIGPFDAIMRGGPSAEMNAAINSLIKASAQRGIAMGRVVGSGTMTDPKQIEDAMVDAINNGARLICVHYLTSDLPYMGAKVAAEPFFRACKRCGF